MFRPRLADHTRTHCVASRVKRRREKDNIMMDCSVGPNTGERHRSLGDRSNLRIKERLRARKFQSGDEERTGN